DGRLLDCRQLAEDLLDLARRDVLGVPAHHVLAPADDIEIAPLVLAKEVAGAHPLAAEGLGVGFWPLVVSEHQPRPLEPEFADLALPHGVPVLVEDRRLPVRAGYAARPRPHHLRLAERHVEGAAALGHAVGLAGGRAEATLEVGMVGLVEPEDL